MQYFNSKTFNPEILYAYDPWNEPGDACQPHQHEFLEISIVLEGEADYIIDGQGIRLGAGRVMLFNPGVIHSETQRENSRSHQLHIGITNIMLTGLSRNFFPNKYPIIELGEHHSQFLECAWRVVKEYNNQANEFHLMGKALINEMLVLIIRGLSSENDDLLEQKLSKVEKRKQNLVNQTIYYLENHYEQEVTLEQLAEIFYVSPTYLSKAFKEVVGVSPINHLIQIRLRQAKELLIDTKLPIKEIASLVGYQDAYYFSKLFKKYHGVAPSQMLSELNS
ncbi:MULTISPECIES: AraC family transcriptional regulator [unclassified Enterococcus]|uniref:helix-turn-helix transcriptional regulator n=1 Tax=unclassified Enterococcus TaxID=2608891 RepID=UPI0015562405|nr:MULTISPECIES: AraC family transcriptional regulator [unclassified Enterococcus]MBS7576060.1 helix-turn-helix transcriptional regulator [Enterococcus sp. MMGLQ5-2]MBS7583293.1 helix-turn-helix transcriptional regulator [Enterococcus sp. MMGLQ5-1]NPD11153.1 helix-turn-helix transcriptional regulator [Enterococcus sp. MMGLQ5-1]NPD35896.1 helix-turn-helix transcriptional regulator [Enterococcus sp. MMGLQ5-2]